ncbi:chemotaxis protein CheA [Sneathiella chinensis]|uniref:Chemotaxis protein CheA n=1 Tax=Sneathiella chinensis TaxID=349750 RepID=A0ABQ5U462_9PROT|nr:chemotaxis protein CheA [Sneathiella chinensis]GLQ06962.1 chemotaxis protein CheA [Sneathiella chinensis]
MDDYSQFKATYFTECDELLADAEVQLAALDDGSDDPEILHAIFRAVHSIKAGAGAFKFTRLTEFSHQFEALLDRMRDGRITVTEEGVALLFRAADTLSAMVEAARTETPLEDDFGQDLLTEIAAMAGSETAPAPASGPVAAEEQTAPSANDPAEQVTPIYRLVFSPKAEMFKHANEPLLLVRELKTLGTLTAEPDISHLPPLAKLDAEEAYLSWTFTLQSDCPLEEIEEVFEFVTEDCDLSITLLPAGDAEKQGISRENGAQSAAAPSGQEQQKQEEDEASSVAPANIPTAAPASPAKTAKATTIRVDLDRVDRLVNMVGELVITQSMLSQQTSTLPTDHYPNMVRGLEELALHTRELQESVMAIRMQPVKSVFSRMPRLVRDLSAKLDKKVKLITKGENTEVDKTVIEEISDPITHMIRNSLDHGLERPEERLALDKTEEGTITLSAEHRGGRIVITISDDGRGINREAVLTRARERGLIADGATLSEDEIDNLVFAPGFSTAEKVTDISGRGVGMDVVRRNIQALGGRVSIHSTPGHGSRFTMTLPLTLAVMDGMIVQLGADKYVIPIPSILESFRPAPQAIKRLPTGQTLVHVRGDYIPLCPLGRIFRCDEAETDPAKALVVLVESEQFGAVGIIVDTLLGQQQVVIKSLEGNYKPVLGISSATILGNGKVAPILDIETLYQLSQAHLRRETRPAPPPPVAPTPAPPPSSNPEPPTFAG